MTEAADYAMIVCESNEEWRQWLDTNHQSVSGVWLRMYKKASGVASVNYAEALDAALCYGWIDGQRRSYDEVSYVQKFTPRRKQSLWSKRNIEYVARLEAAGLMTPSGRAEVERAKADGRWAAAYDKPSEMTAGADLLQALDDNPAAKQFYEALNKTNVYAINWRLQTAKTAATRQRRLNKIIADLVSGVKPA